jgi:protein phosphatase
MSDTQDAKNVTHFDAVGDVHGCHYELLELVEKLGYVEGDDGLYRHPEGRKLVLVGDITDRGYYNSLALQLVYRHWKAGEWYWVQGNHDNKMFRWMKGNPVRPSHGLQKTITELEQGWPFDEDREELGQYLLDEVPTKIELDDGNVVAVHAYNGKSRLRMYGKRGGPDNERIEWWKDYEGPEFVVFGHYWLNDPTVYEHYCCVDTSCVCGETLTAMRWPEREVVQVDAKQVYYESR